MKKEYDFSEGKRGRFHRPGGELNIPVYLDPDVAAVVRKRAGKTNTDIGATVNEWLRSDVTSRKRPRPAKGE